MKIKKANLEDAKIIYDLANDIESRKNSFQSSLINYEDHLVWISNKLKNNSLIYYLYYDDSMKNIGFVRFDFNEFDNIIASIVVDKNFRGKGFASKMIINGINELSSEKKFSNITAYVLKSNTPSLKSFINAGFIIDKELIIQNKICNRLIKIK